MYFWSTFKNKKLLHYQTLTRSIVSIKSSSKNYLRLWLSEESNHQGVWLGLDKGPDKNSKFR